MGAFSGFKDAKRGFQSNPLNGNGRYVVRLDDMDLFDTENKGEMYKITATILAVDDGDHRIGEVVHIFYKVSVGKKVFQRNVKGFIAGVMNVADEDVDESDALATVEDDSPMIGLVTTVTSKLQTSKDKVDEKTGNPVQYTTYSWSPSLGDDEIEEAIGAEGLERFFPNGL